MGILKRNSQILVKPSGEIIRNTGNASTKILHIDADLQLPNRIIKDGSNLVRQITDKAKNKILLVNGSATITYNYSGYYVCSTGRYSLNDDNIVSGHTLYFHLNPSSHSSVSTTGIIYSKGNFIFRQKANANNFEILINGSVVIDYGYTASSEKYFAIHIDASYVYLIENGIIKAKASYSGLSATGNSEMFGDGTNFYKGNFYALKRWNIDVFNISGKSVNDVVSYFTGDFTHIVRYKPDGYKKLYISSKYLKDAIIDSSNNIEKILIPNSGYDASGNKLQTYVIQATAGNKPTITDEGIKFVRANYQYLRAGNDSTLGIPSGYYWWSYCSSVKWFFGMWHKPESNTSDQWFAQFGQNDSYYMVLIWNNSVTTGRYTFFNGASVISPTTIFPLNKWNHVAMAQVEGDGIYCFINGIYVGKFSSVKNWPNTFIGCKLGGTTSSSAADCQINDVLLEVERPLIDPTGKSIGQKVFEPPRRGGFEGTFKTY